MPKIAKMTTGEWINYREGLIEKHLAGGGSLEPNPDCPYCDVPNEYLCFYCECNQLDKELNYA
jgi:hypothetical protein